MMIIGSRFNKKNQRLLNEVSVLSGNDTSYKIPVKEINKTLAFGRTEVKNMLEYLEQLGYVKIRTIGGPLLYGHISITEKGLKKTSEDES